MDSEVSGSLGQTGQGRRTRSSAISLFFSSSCFMSSSALASASGFTTSPSTVSVFSSFAVEYARAMGADRRELKEEREVGVDRRKEGVAAERDCTTVRARLAKGLERNEGMLEVVCAGRARRQ